MTRHSWTKQETSAALEMKKRGMSDHQIAEALNRTFHSVNSKLSHMRNSAPVPSSPMPKLDAPLTIEGDALVLSDVEAPYHHSDFVNRALDLAQAWGIQNLILAGDMLHYDSLSLWGAEWQANAGEIIERVLEVLGDNLRDKAAVISALMDAGLLNTNSGYSSEMRAARQVFSAFSQFGQIYCAIGNHDDRLLRRLDAPLGVDELLRQMGVQDDGRWHIRPYYHIILRTEAGEYRITHPRNAGRTAAQDLAVQFHQHVIMGHSHRWSINRDPSGKYWAIQTGHCVDETRLAYVMQRDAKRDAHVLGATIVRGGYPFVLCPESPFEVLKRM